MALRTNCAGSSTNADVSAMWMQIERMPFQHLQETADFKYVEKVMTLVGRYVFSESDPIMRDSKYTCYVAKLLQIVSSKCLTKFSELERNLREATAESANMRSGFDAQLAVKNGELERLRKALQSAGSGEAPTKGTESATASEEAARIKTENDTLALKIHSLTRQNEELRQTLAARSDDRAIVNDTYDKAQLEYRHLAARYKRLSDRFAKTEDMLEEARRRERAKRHDTLDEGERLRQKVQTLQQENYSLVQSRDRAEELCEKREAEALRDMTELRRLNRDLLDEERSKSQALRDEFFNAREEADAHVEQLIQQHERDLEEKEEEIAIIQRQLEKVSTRLKGRFDTDMLNGTNNSSSRSSTSNGGSADSGDGCRQSSSAQPQPQYQSQNHGVSTQEQRKVERENDDLRAEVEQLELRIDALDEENRRLTRLIKNYESGNEGLYRLRQELADQTRSVEVLQSENAQLRERLNGMEDSITFNAALRELCKRVGVTEEEINSLRPQNATAYSEMDTLKEELSLLKEEVEWLERERRYWMNKVRLQPLMDTKLRFELGLTSDQLKQLDRLVDQMKSGEVVVEDNDVNYKEKYFKELQARRRDAEQFSDYVKQRINDALKDAFVDVGNTGTAAAVSQLHDHIDVITATPSTESIAKADEQLRSMAQRLEEYEQTAKTLQEEVVRLREQVVAGSTEKEMIIRERDQYREAIFGAAGMGSGDADVPALGDFGEISAGNLSNAKWLKVSNTLREQLRTKDTLIDSLGKEMSEMREKLAAERQREGKTQQEVENQKKCSAALQDQIKALTELNQESVEKCSALSKVNKDLEDGLGRLDHSTAKEMLLKVVLLRRREATLLQRLRRALSAQEDAASSEEKLQSQVTSTLEKLRETLEGSNGPTGSVLPRSSASCSMEGEMLGFLDSAVQHVLQGKLFREDSRFLIHLKQVYQGMEAKEETMELRLDARRLRGELEAKQKEMDALTVEAAGLRATLAAAADAKANTKPEYKEAALAKAEAEAAAYKQKYTLLAKRLEARDTEVGQLESDLDSARNEVVEVREHIRNILSNTADPQSSTGGGDAQQRSTQSATQMARLEKEVARLKSVNLGLLHHSLDLQAQVRSLEIEVSAKQQEVTLLKSSPESQVVTNFVSAAIREHAALRRQSELALIQAKRLRMQLAAAEANYHIVANEATNYKLGAYRLYRKYVDQVVSVVDYLRCVQRASKGALSPHQAEIMDRRLGKAVADLGIFFSRNKLLALEVSDAQSTVTTLEQQIVLLGMKDNAAKRDALDARLQDARARVRAHERLVVEHQEETQYLEGKLRRAEVANKDLNAEVARLEFGYWTVSPLDGELLATLLQLKESVFDKTLAPSVVGLNTSLPIRRSGADKDGDDAAIREYKSAILRQTELAQQCATLKKQVADVGAEQRRAEHKAIQLREEAQQLSGRVIFAQRQLEDEREKANQREVRLQRAYETQTEVARRATEQNVQCLQEMLQKKDQRIASLQEQVAVGRQKFTEHELDEAVRMERLHEHMFRENAAMVERFKSAIETVGDSMRQTGDGAAGAATNPHLLLSTFGNGMEEQLQVLTTETARLRQELKEARTANIVLESQLEQQVQRQLSCAAIARADTTAEARPSVSQNATNTDALMGIIRNQNAMLESLRQREMHLSGELQREKDLRLSTEKQLDDVQRQRIDHGGALQLLSHVTGGPGGGSDAPLVGELRAQNAYLDQELRGLRQVLEEERAQAKRFQVDAAEWKTHLDALQAEVATQQVNTEHAQHLATLNEGLQADLNFVKEQNDKLVLAATVLKQKLLEEAHHSGASTRQHQQEIALAQRMGTLQQESAGHMKVLDHRIRAIQKELNERVEKEKGILEKNTESQRLVYQLHQQLREKDRELVALRDQLRNRPSSPTQQRQQSTARGVASSLLTENKGTQMLSTSAKSPLSPHTAEGGDVAARHGVRGVSEATAAVSATNAAAATSSPPPLASSHSASGSTFRGGRPASAAAAAAASSRTSRSPARAEDALVQPQIAGIVQRETQRQQRDNLSQISTLRSRVHRLEKDMEDAEEQLRGERESSRQLRLQLRQAREELSRKETEHVAQLAVAYHQRVNAESQLSRQQSAGASSSTPPAPSNAEATLRLEVLELKQSNRQFQQALIELRDTHAGATTAAAVAADSTDLAQLASPLDIRAHVAEVRRLESVIDELRRRLAVDASAKENELQYRLTQTNAVLQRMAADLASLRGLSVTEIESIYVTTTTTVQQTADALNAELLRKSNEVLELRFAVETLELQRRRTERHLNDVLAVDANASAHAKRVSSTADATNTETLTNVIENLRLVIEKLQRENNDLHSAEVKSARYARQSQALHELQERERTLQGQLQHLSQQVVSARRPLRDSTASSASNTELYRRLATAQASAEQYEAELEDLRQRLSSGGGGDTEHRNEPPLDPARSASPDVATVSSTSRPTVPPPLPQSRFSHNQHPHHPARQRHVSSLTASRDTQLQRRLSSRQLRSCDGDDDGGAAESRHASLPHHQMSGA